MKFSVLLLLSIVTACSGGGGGGGGSERVEYKTVYIYPENTLQVGEGTVEVDAVDAVCLDNKGNEVDISNCVVDIPNAPKDVQKSPAGSTIVEIENSDEGQIIIEFGEGESWSSYEDSLKRELVEDKVTCLSGFDLTFRGSCEVYVPEFRYGPWPENDMVACSVSRTVTRDAFCRSNITGLDVDLTECSSLTPDISTTQLSPAGQADITLSNGDTVTLNCGVGVGEDGIALGESSIITSHECGSDRHMVDSSCIDDTFMPIAYQYEDLVLTAGQGIQMADAIAVTECRRQHNDELVDASKCSIPSEVPQIPVSSPAGTILVIVEGSDTPVSVTVEEGQTWADVPVEEKVSQLEGNVTCNSGTLLAHTAQCLTPEYSAVLGEYPENPLSACEGKTTIYQPHQCLYNITGQLTDASNCANTSESMEVLSPSGTKENVTLANGDVVNLLCAEGGTPSDIGSTASVLYHHSCGEDRYLNSESICVPEIFTPTEFGFIAPDPALQVGEGELVVEASSVIECRRISDNNTVDPSKCVLPETLPTQTFLSPAGDFEGDNVYGDRVVFALKEGEVLSTDSEQKSIVSCSELRVDDGTGTACRYLNVSKIEITRGGTNPYLSLTYDNGGVTYLDRFGGTSQYPELYNAFMSASAKATDPSTYFIHTTDNKIIFRASSSTVRVIENVHKYFVTGLGIVVVDEAGVSSWISTYNGSDIPAQVPFGSTNLNDIAFLHCHSSYMNTANGCLMMDALNNRSTAGTGINAYTYNTKSWQSGGMYFNEMQSFVNLTSQLTNIKQIIPVRDDSLLVLRNDGTVLYTGQKNTLNASNQSTPSTATIPTAVATGVSQIFRVNGENFVKKTDGTLRKWSVNNVTQILSGLNANEAKSVGNRHLLYNNGTIVTNFALPDGVPSTGIKAVNESSQTTTLITEDNQYFMILGTDLVKSGTFLDISYSPLLEGIFVKGLDGKWVSVKHDDSEIDYVDPKSATLGKFLNPSILDPTISP